MENVLEDIEFKINRDDQGVIEGFTLMGSDEFDSYDKASFCYSFHLAQPLGKARVSFKDNKIVFTHDGIVTEHESPTMSILGSHEV